MIYLDDSCDTFGDEMSQAYSRVFHFRYNEKITENEKAKTLRTMSEKSGKFSLGDTWF